MEREDFVKTITRCLRKAFLDVAWSFSTDEDQVAKICLASDGYLIINYVRTPYCIFDVERVKYGIDQLKEDYYIFIYFSDERALKIGSIGSTDYIVLQAEKNEEIIVYKHTRRKLLEPNEVHRGS